MKIVSLLVGLSAIFLFACNGSKHEMRQQVPLVDQQKGSASRAIMGLWINTSNNGGGPLGSTMNFRADGKVIVKYVGEKELVLPYYLNTIDEWIAFEQRDHTKKWDPNSAKDFKKAFGPCYLVFFGQKTDDSLANQNALLFEPISQTLYQPLTQEWMREGPARKALAAKQNQ